MNIIKCLVSARHPFRQWDAEGHHGGLVKSWDAGVGLPGGESCLVYRHVVRLGATTACSVLRTPHLQTDDKKNICPQVVVRINELTNTRGLEPSFCNSSISGSYYKC